MTNVPGGIGTVSGLQSRKPQAGATFRRQEAKRTASVMQDLAGKAQRKDHLLPLPRVTSYRAPSRAVEIRSPASALKGKRKAAHVCFSPGTDSAISS
jgi:hypothetical protein